MPAPDPKDWLRVNLEVQQRAQKDILAVLRESDRRIKSQLDAILRRPAVGPGELVRQEQLRLVQRNLRLEMSKIWRELGDVIQARRYEAAARTIGLGEELNDFLLTAVGGLEQGADIAASIASAEAANAASGLDRMIARMQGQSYRPLSQTVYNSSVNINGKVDRLVNTALARGLSAREVASEVRQFINPNTPGGVRYASMRLARTEINNAAHAVAANHMQGSPWIEAAKWNLSSSHPKPDICDQLAHGGPHNNGTYPKGDIPGKPHPQCFCYITPELPSDEDFLDALVGGKYDDHLSKHASPEEKALHVVPSSAPSSSKKSIAEKYSSGVQSSKALAKGRQANVDFLQLKDGSSAVRKVFNPRSKVRNAADAADAEVLASELASKLGLRAADSFKVSKHEVVSEFMEGRVFDSIPLEERRSITGLFDSDEAKRVGLFDLAIGNVDRNSANFLLRNDGGISLIDHGAAFPSRSVEARMQAILDGPGFANQLAGSFDKYSGEFIGPSSAYSKADLDFIRAQARSMSDSFQALDRQAFLDLVEENLDFLERYARGTGSLFSPVEATTAEARELTALEKSLRSGVKRSRNLSGGAIADTRLVTAKDGTKYVSKRTGKTASGAQELLQEAIRQQDAEVLASKVGKAFGVDVPEVIRISDTEIAMEFKQGRTYVDTIDKLYEQDKTREVAELELSLSGSDQGKLMGLFDQVIYNIDRHEGNFLLNKGKVSGIDHGYAFRFEEEDHLKPVAGAGAFFSEQFTDFVRVPGVGGRLVFGGPELEAMSQEDFRELKRRLFGVRDEFAKLDRLDWYDKVILRIDEMLKHAKGTRRIL